jgi:hypothetical protein
MEEWKEKGLRLYHAFEGISMEELELMLIDSSTREERAVYRTMINLKLQLMQEKVTGEELL